LFWILYDIFVWNKALTQARPENYFGLIISITSLILGIKFGKNSTLGKSIPVLEHNSEKNRIKKACYLLVEVAQAVTGYRIQKG